MGSIFVAGPKVDRLRAAYDHLRAAALDPQESVAMIKSVIADLECDAMRAGEKFTPTELASVAWRKSSRSGSAGGGNCVQVGVLWRTSSRSGSGGGSNCVEVGTGAADGRILVRDSKDPAGGLLSCSPAQWASFTATLKSPARND